MWARLHIVEPNLQCVSPYLHLLYGPSSSMKFMLNFGHNNYPPDLGGIEDVDEILIIFTPYDVPSCLFLCDDCPSHV